ncbi:hypothetical protein ABZ806_40725 [Spirillospora sp. NPDC047418]
MAEVVKVEVRHAEPGQGLVPFGRAPEVRLPQVVGALAGEDQRVGLLSAGAVAEMPPQVRDDRMGSAMVRRAVRDFGGPMISSR